MAADWAKEMMGIPAASSPHAATVRMTVNMGVSIRGSGEAGHDQKMETGTLCLDNKCPGRQTVERKGPGLKASIKSMPSSGA